MVDRNKNSDKKSTTDDKATLEMVCGVSFLYADFESAGATANRNKMYKPKLDNNN